MKQIGNNTLTSGPEANWHVTVLRDDVLEGVGRGNKVN
jgi:hypothetical protein